MAPSAAQENAAPAAKRLLFVFRGEDLAVLTRWLPDASVSALFARAVRESAPYERGQWMEDHVDLLAAPLGWALEPEDEGDTVPELTDVDTLVRVLRAGLAEDEEMAAVHADPHSLRVLLPGGAAALYLFDEVALRDPRLMFYRLLADRTPLPTVEAERPDSTFDPAAWALELRGTAATKGDVGRTYAVITEMEAIAALGELEGTLPTVVEGVRLTGLDPWLRSVQPLEEWSVPFRARRPSDLPILAWSERPGDDDAELAARVAEWAQDPTAPREHFCSWPVLWEILREDVVDSGSLSELWRRRASDYEGEDDEAFAGARVESGVHHLALLTPHAVGVVFDDVWASHHPALANSILLWGNQWDPLQTWPGFCPTATLRSQSP